MRPIEQVRKICQKHQALHFVAGDIFHKWDESVETIHFARKFFPPCFAISGNHDTPFHNYKMRKKSAYWMLVECGVVQDIPYNEPLSVGYFELSGFSWPKEVHPPIRSPHDFMFRLALVHSYIWTKKTGYVGASYDHRALAYKDKVQGYDFAIFGDNHHGFLLNPERGPKILNCGAPMIQKSSEINIRPSIGLIWSNGTIERFRLDTSQDKYVDWDDAMDLLNKHKDVDMEEVLAQLKKLGGRKNYDFKEALEQYFLSFKVPKKIRRHIFQALGDSE